ncbi:hypothetical protein NDU88_006039 [Pleurodeles waltl]|uniref:Uncharacterized protein n=1 Tax=Pleurodeles waltl TaxID=8319 RepID=A0AAV7WDJ2_PLEWA|nr:hypothetical protein NDU88_006039 [Pleurodeles waltl]
MYVLDDHLRRLVLAVYEFPECRETRRTTQRTRMQPRGEAELQENPRGHQGTPEDDEKAEIRNHEVR